jgi:hypothetical protein
MIRMFKSQQFRGIVIVVAVTLGFQAISALTGFSDWVRATPAATAVSRVLATLFFGGIGIAGLLGGRWEYRLIGLLFLILACGHLALLVTGAHDPADLLTHNAAPFRFGGAA